MGDTGMASGVSPADRPPSQARTKRGRPRNGAGDRPDEIMRQHVDRLYHAYYRSLVRLAALLTSDELLAEEIAAESLIAVIACRADIGEQEHTLLRLHQQVVLRSRRVAIGGAARPNQPVHYAANRHMPSGAWASSPVVQALRSLPARQREAAVLRLYLDLSEKETAAAMGASQRTVRRLLASLSEAVLADLAGGSACSAD